MNIWKLPFDQILAKIDVLVIEIIPFYFPWYVAYKIVIFCNRYRVLIVDAFRFTSADKLFISDRNPLVFVDVVASNTVCKC